MTKGKKPQEAQDGHVLFVLLVVSSFFFSGCGQPAQKPPATQVVRMVTVLGRTTTPLAEALTKVLPDHFPARIEVQKTQTTQDYVRLLLQGQAELAIIQTDL